MEIINFLKIKIRLKWNLSPTQIEHFSKNLKGVRLLLEVAEENFKLDMTLARPTPPRKDLERTFPEYFCVCVCTIARVSFYVVAFLSEKIIWNETFCSCSSFLYFPHPLTLCSVNETSFEVKKTDRLSGPTKCKAASLLP